LATLIGVFSLIVVSSVMSGFNQSIRTKLLSVEPHVAISLSPEDDKKTGLNLKESIESVLAAFEDVQVSRFAKQDVILRNLDGRFSGGIAKGLDEEGLSGFVARIERLRFKGNANVSEITLPPQIEDHEILMGSELARELNVFEGDEIMVIPPETLLAGSSAAPKFERMRVRSLFTTEFSEIDSKLIYYKLADKPYRFQSLISGTKGFEVRLKNPDDFQKVITKLGQLKSEDALSSDTKIESWADRNKALFFALRLEKTAMTTFLSLSVLITCFSLITVLVMMISQKRKEIGLLMSLGLSQYRVKKLFLFVGVILSGLGLFVGLTLGLIVSHLLQMYPLEILPDIYYDSSLPSFCLVIAVIAAYWPVKLYVDRSPSDNLRKFVQN
jgi:lipoprotein-releasing system permease protein